MVAVAIHGGSICYLGLDWLVDYRYYLRPIFQISGLSDWMMRIDKWLGSLIITALLILFLGLRLYMIGAESLWMDEAHTWWLGRLDWVTHFKVLREIGVHPPLYFSTSKLISDLFGQQEIVLRSLSILAGLLGLVSAMLLGMKIAGYWGLFAAGWFWTFHPMLIWYARDARPYSLAAGLAMLVLYLYFSLRSNGRKYYWAISIACLSLGMLTHFFFLLFAFSLILLALLEIRDKPPFFRKWTISTLLASMPLCLWVIWYFLQDSPSLGIGWIRSPNPGDLGLSLFNLIAGYAGVFTIAAGLFCLAFLAICFGNLLQGEEKGFRIGILIVGLILPVLSVYLISQRRAIYMDRYFIVLIPFVTSILCYGVKGWDLWLAGVNNKGKYFLISLIIAVVICIGMIAGIQSHRQAHYTREDWKLLSILVRSTFIEDTQPEIWLSDPESLIALEYYTQQPIQIQDSLDLGSYEDENTWLIFRQPYTATHAFAQSVSEPDRESSVEPMSIPPEFHRWESPSGIHALYFIASEMAP